MYKPRYLHEDSGDSEFESAVMAPLKEALKIYKEVLKESLKLAETTQGDAQKHINLKREQAEYLLKKALVNMQAILESQGNDHLFNRINNVHEALIGASTSMGKGDMRSGISVRSLLIEIYNATKGWPENTSLQRLSKSGALDSMKISYENRCLQFNQILEDMQLLFSSLDVPKYRIPETYIYGIFK